MCLYVDLLTMKVNRESYMRLGYGFTREEKRTVRERFADDKIVVLICDKQ